VLEVEDEGPGIDRESSTRIFDPFFTPKKTGRGLGLAVVQGIVRAHSGTIEVVSTPGNTVFRIELPAAIVGVAQDDDATPDAVQGASSGHRERSVLVIDDDAAVRSVLRRRLEHAGISVFEASDGVRGEEAFAARPDAFDLVILDLTMPGRGGEEVLRTLRQLRPSIPVVLISGYSTDSIATPLAADPWLCFLRKPFRGEDLLRAIDDLLAIV
jgi:CheY-like chemotaxis protein